MDDLVFKNIPAEGFDPQIGNNGRFSNPSLSRIDVVPNVPQNESNSPSHESSLSDLSVKKCDDNTDHYDESSRLSNPTPSRRGKTASGKISDIQSVSDPLSRISNPTPTRRGTSETSCFESVLQDFSPSSVSDMENEAFARASNPTPTRRKVSVKNINVPDLGTVSGSDGDRASNPTPRRRIGDSPFSMHLSEGDASQMNSIHDEDFLRASNPTPTRRGGTTSMFPKDAPEFDEKSSLSFTSVTDPYGAGRTEDSRASNPTPTRRLFGSDSAPTDDEYDDSSRLSNISPSSRR